MPQDYSTESYKKYLRLLRGVLTELPKYCADFFRGKDFTTSIRTRYAYAVDIRTFFNFLVEHIPEFFGKQINEITLSELETVTRGNIEEFLESVSFYNRNGSETINKEEAKMRKLSALRSFYMFFYKNGQIHTPVPSLVDLPKLHKKPIIHLEPNEIADLLVLADTSEGATQMSTHRRAYLEKTRKRDVAILTLFLGTGIRVSELVGIDIDDVNFVSNEFSIVRKGGDRDILSFGQEVRAALLDYMTLRENEIPCEGHENALFLSIQRKRISVRAVEDMVKKFASIAVPQKKITPHKLRSTYGTMLYNETGDIYLVADVLGHKDVNITRKHYASMSKERRRRAAEIIKLKDDTDKDKLL